MVGAVPTYEVLLEVLQRKWAVPYEPQPSMSIAELLAAPDTPLRTGGWALESGKLVRAAKDAATGRVRRLSLHEMPAAFQELGESLHGAVRSAVANMRAWRGQSAAACLEVVQRLAFSDDAAASEAVLRHFAAEASPDHLPLYPDILVELRLGAGFHHAETSKSWVERMIHETTGSPAGGIVFLVEHLLSNWYELQANIERKASN